MTSKTTRRKKADPEVILPAYESPSDDKYTFCARTENEFTVIFRVPVGREGRKMTAKLLPFFRHMDKFMNSNGAINDSMIFEFFDVAAALWDDDKFDTEILPFVFGLRPDDERLENVGLMDAFQGFMQGVSYILSGASDEGFQEAEKNSEKGVEKEE